MASPPREFNSGSAGTVVTGLSESLPARELHLATNAGFQKKAGPLMSSRPVHAIASQTLRHWTIDNQEFVAGSPRPAPVPSHSEWVEGGQFQLLASKLARVKSALARQTG